MYGILGYAEIFGMDGEEVCVSERGVGGEMI